MKLHGDRESFMIKASIIITAYNVEDYIEKCIMSAINQTEKNIEIIIVNDGSTDCTLNKINILANYDKRIRIIDKKNEGVMKARYDGLEIAIGKYILFVDADDWIEERCIEKLFNIAERSSCDIVIYNYYTVNKSNILKCMELNADVDDYLKSVFIGQTSQYLWDKFIRRKFIFDNKISFYGRLSYAEDLAILSNLYIMKPKVEILDEPLYYYFQRENSLTKKINDKVVDINESLEYIKNMLKINNIYSVYKDEFDMCIYLNLFIYVVIASHKFNLYVKKIYNMYKDRNIMVKGNIYIIKYIDNYNRLGRLRINIYQKSYKCGILYDFIRDKIKNIIKKNK